MKTKLPMVALLGFVLVAAASCGGSDGLSTAEEEELQMQLAAAEAAKAEAERQRQAAEAQAAADAKAAEEARQAREKAEADAKKAEEEKQAAEKLASDAAEAAKKAAEAAAAAQKAADKAKADAKAEADKLAAEKQRAEEEAKKREEAERAAQQAQQEAERRIEEAERQANVAVRAPLLIDELTGTTVDDAGAVMGVTHMPGESRIFTRPLNLPAKGSAPSVPGSWSSASYSGPRGTVGTDTVYLYSNIQAPSKRKFWKLYGESQEISGTNTMARTTGSRSTPRLTAGGDTPDDTSDDMYRVTYSGTFDGAGGTFSCTAANRDTCVLTNAATVTGGLDVTGGTWTFAPSSVNNLVGSLLTDRTYLYFGIWSHETAAAAGTPDFKWAAGGDADDIPTANFTALSGEATFTGGAIGKYALAKVGGRAAKIGTFTATASFTADFGTADTAASTLSGRITDFKEGGTSLGSDWNVFLGSDEAMAATLAASGVTGTLEAHGAIDGDTAEGAWAATLHGSGNPGTTNLDRDKYPLSSYPVADVAGVSGWFNATAGSNAAIAGAFGAACTTGTMCAK